MRIERHIFGSIRGYTTLAGTRGVSPDDRRTLESTSFAFGQGNDPRYLRTLSKHPAFFTRTLPGRRCLTRVFEGKPDDNGRPTLLLITVILDAREWDRELLGDVQYLLDRSELWQWDGTAEQPPLDIPAPPPPRQLPARSVPRLLTLLSELERAQIANRRVVVSASEYGLADMAALEILIPPAARPRMTTAYRGLSPQLPAAVNALAAEAIPQNINFRSGAAAGPLAPYAAMLEQTRLPSGEIPLEQIMTYRQFGQSAPTTPAHGPMPSATPPPVIVQRGSMAPVLMVAALSVVLTVCGYLLAHLQAQQEIRQLQARVAQLEGETGKTLKQLQSDLSSTQSRAKSETDRLNNEIALANARIDELRGESEKFSDFITNDPRPALEAAFTAYDKLRESVANDRKFETSLNDLNKVAAAMAAVPAPKNGWPKDVVARRQELDRKLAELDAVRAWWAMALETRTGIESLEKRKAEVAKEPKPEILDEMRQAISRLRNRSRRLIAEPPAALPLARDLHDELLKQIDALEEWTRSPKPAATQPAAEAPVRPATVVRGGPTTRKAGSAQKIR